ncbi:MAG TPA: peptidoglycan-binding domain-containing protein [Acidobacteriaceae bacterium]|nr:peptidoglycan-binding domain-containing protein [Acidobacteriaceae bacterium]
MVLFRTSQVVLFSALLIATPAFASRTHRAATAGHVRHHSRHHHFVPGQRTIQPERAKEIQDALIREHYLTGPASGQWDAATEAAMQKYQADHGWQTRLTPDSRALIKLGLGPHDDAVPPGATAPGPTDAAATPAPAPAAGTLAATNTIQN